MDRNSSSWSYRPVIRLALGRGQQPRRQRAAHVVDLGGDRRPVGAVHAFRPTLRSGSLCCLQIQQEPLGVRAAAVAAEVAAGLDHPVAGHDDGRGLVAHAVPTARNARGLPTAAAIVAYEAVCPYPMPGRWVSTSRRNPEERL